MTVGSELFAPPYRERITRVLPTLFNMSPGCCKGTAILWFRPETREKHLGRYVQEFAGRRNAWSLDTGDQLGKMVRDSSDKRLTYSTLVGPKMVSQRQML